MPREPQQTRFHQARERFMQLAHVPVGIPLGKYRAEILYWGFFEPKYWRNFLHTHSFYEICYAYQGRGTFRLGSRDYPIKAGDVFIARPDDAHEIISDRRKPLGIYFWAYTLTPSAQKAREPDAGVDAVLDAFTRAKRWVARPLPAMRRTLEMLGDEAAEKRPGYPQAIEALTSKLLLDTARAVTDIKPLIPHLAPLTLDPAQTIVRTAERYLRDNFSRPISVADVAQQAYVSERHLARVFQAQTGKSVIDYLTALRLDAARQLLLDPNLTIKQVAREAGYPDVKYFMTAFRKHAGMTAGQFRKTRGTRFFK